MRRAATIALVCLALLMSRCTSPAVEPGTTWIGPAGDPVPLTVIAVSHGPEHCGWDDTLFLQVDWSRIDIQGKPPFAGTTTYVFNPAKIDMSGDELSTSFETEIVTPPDVIETGYRTDDVGLWVEFGEGEAAYLVGSDGRGQRWPVLHAGCA